MSEHNIKRINELADKIITGKINRQEDEEFKALYALYRSQK
ncbi:hypothetical protein RGQ13_14485 [Thalassotalea psychrophila]|uniref:Uncharacterized protein n=1 Tax=Thalassotalea psychrophila TaxID=3065647 RepID=A0ABY9TSP2_9GAMM|nr:hypothetical protein RGQ13_14485 [Colwelliaceae bacterium SQ149]